MKNTRVLKLVIAVILIAFIKPEGYTQSGGVDWIHGLGGNNVSLEDVANHYESLRPIVSPTRNSYPTGDGISVMATSVQAQTGGPNRLAISHSLGGTAVRQVTIWSHAHWKGVVTMGSPLRGAQIAASGTNGVNQGFINNGHDRMMAGPQVGAGMAPPLFPGIGLELEPTGILGQVFSSEFAYKANKKLMDAFGLTGNTAADLNPASAYQNNIAVHSVATPKILVWGNEVYPILWRIVGTYTFLKHEQNGIDLANKVAGLHQNIANGEEVLSWANLPLHGFHQWRKGKWLEGRDWVNTDSNTGWQNVIGATYTETVTNYYPHDRCGPEGFAMCELSNSYAYCVDYCTEWIPYTQTIYHNEASDGVVTYKSATNNGGSWQGYHREAQNVNHGEFKRVDRVEPTLNWVFNGGNNTPVFRISY